MDLQALYTALASTLSPNQQERQVCKSPPLLSSVARLHLLPQPNPTVAQWVLCLVALHSLMLKIWGCGRPQRLP